MALSKAQAAEREQSRQSAIRSLSEDFASGHVTVDASKRPVVYTIVTHVSRSGMSRRMRLFTVYAGNIWEITGRVARALGWRTHARTGELIVDGCGMDMGFHTVYSLSHALYVYAGPDSGDAGYRLAQNWM